MPITAAQKAQAEQQQLRAAQDPAPQVRVVAGPGCGKSRTIEKRVLHVLSLGASPETVHVISFTRAACTELRQRILSFCAKGPHAGNAQKVRVSTMHSLGLRLLRLGNLLTHYPSDPTVLDDWEQEHIYDAELASALACTQGRAEQVRLAHDAKWQTLDSAYIDQAEVTPAEVKGFNRFHATRTNLYSCVLPGEVIYKCVDAITMGAMDPAHLPSISHLIVDEFQDLNACDQEFVRLLCQQGAVLFVAGDDDRSIYMFRHAKPDGIVHFEETYPRSTKHILSDCFRCSPAILAPASKLLLGRVPKLVEIGWK
jgi:DNA helicase-2/ATP-dependent DNA helicase PcrA